MTLAQLRRREYGHGGAIVRLGQRTTESSRPQVSVRPRIDGFRLSARPG